MAARRLTPALKTKIVDSSRETCDFDAVAAATGVSYEELSKWLQRGARETTGIHRDLLEEVKPFLSVMYKRQTPRTISNFFAQLAEIAKRDKQFERILTVWFNAMWLNDSRLSDQSRTKMAMQTVKALGRPIHPDRWRSLKLPRLPQSEVEKSMLSDIFFAADLLKEEHTDDPPPVSEQIHGDFQNMRRMVANLVTEDFAGPGWRKRKTETDCLDDIPDPSIQGIVDRELEFKNQQELRQYMFQRLAFLLRKKPQVIIEMIKRRRPSTIDEFAKVLGVSRLKLYRKVIGPTRKSKREITS